LEKSQKKSGGGILTHTVYPQLFFAMLVKFFNLVRIDDVIIVEVCKVLVHNVPVCYLYLCFLFMMLLIVLTYLFNSLWLHFNQYLIFLS